VFSVFALLKTNSRGKQAPSEELITGSIQMAKDEYVVIAQSARNWA
jgi:hypothetical protein